MKRILTLDKGQSGEWYGQASPEGEALRCRRLKQCGRLELLQITNDAPPYWFVMIRNFNQSETGSDRKALKGLTTPWGNGVWRFQNINAARTKFEQLSQLPLFVAEEQKRQDTRAKRVLAGRERIGMARAALFSSKNPM